MWEKKREQKKKERQERIYKNDESVKVLKKMLTEQYAGRSIILKYGLIGKIVEISGIDGLGNASSCIVAIGDDTYEVSRADIFLKSELKREKE